MLKLESVALSYGAINAVKDVSLEVRPGEVVTIIGANGAGKSTLLKGIVGLEPLASGKIYIEGQDCTHTPAHARVRLGVALSPEGRGVFADQTVRENLMLGAYTLRDQPEEVPVAGADVEDRLDRGLDLLDLLHHAGDFLARFGVQQRDARAGAHAALVEHQRGGRADEVAQSIVWLLSDAASYTTMALLDVSGGR